MRPFLSVTFPQGFRISKNIGHPTLESGGKKPFKRYLKSEHMDKQTDGRTDRQTDRQTDGHFDLKKASAQRADDLDLFGLEEEIAKYFLWNCSVCRCNNKGPTLKVNLV